MREPLALTSSTTVFAASWRDSNCTIRANDHRKQKNYQDKDSGNQNRGVPKVHLTRHHGVRLGQPCLNGTGLLLGYMKSSLRDLEVDLKLAIFPSCLRIAVLSHPPLSEKTLGVVTIVGVGRI